MIIVVTQHTRLHVLAYAMPLLLELILCAFAQCTCVHVLACTGKHEAAEANSCCASLIAVAASADNA